MIDPCRLWLQQKRNSPILAALAAAGDGNASPPATESQSDSSRVPATGLHALLVEDQTIIAMDTESMLLELGAASVHSCTTAGAALTWLKNEKTDIGVLDISLGEGTSFPVADYLRSASVPFVFTTGYDDSGAIPERFADVPVARKPYTLKTLAAAIDLCLRTRGANT
ncbi:MAG: response regulator [Hyphomicrobium sp.]